MPVISCDCGYQDAPQGLKLLAYHGPLLWVDVGFDPSYKDTNQAPPAAGKARIYALVDTGARYGCIDGGLAAELNLPIVDRGKVIGVTDGSPVEVNIHLAQVHVPALKFTQQGRFAAVPLVAGGHRYDVLLGRSFLSYCQMQYDGVTGAVKISRVSQ